MPLNGPPSTEMWVSVGPRLYGSLPAQSVCWWAWPERSPATVKIFGKPAKPEATPPVAFSFCVQGLRLDSKVASVWIFGV